MMMVVPCILFYDRQYLIGIRPPFPVQSVDHERDRQPCTVVIDNRLSRAANQCIRLMSETAKSHFVHVRCVKKGWFSARSTALGVKKKWNVKKELKNVERASLY